MSGSDPKALEDFHGYMRELSARRVEDNPTVKRWHIAKRIMWMILLATAFLFYYLIDKLSEALSLL